jgi:adenylyltransferase/sulfurtransferase
MEVIKLVVKKGEPLLGRFLIYQALETDFRTFSVKRNPFCPLCGSQPTITRLIDCYDQPASCSLH